MMGGVGLLGDFGFVVSFGAKVFDSGCEELCDYDSISKAMAGISA